LISFLTIGAAESRLGPDHGRASTPFYAARSAASAAPGFHRFFTEAVFEKFHRLFTKQHDEVR
jgi:hypothetical protein